MKLEVEKAPFLFLVALLIMTAAVAPAATDVVDITNAIRARGCGDAIGVGQPLRSRQPLNDAARRVSNGDRLQKATSDSGYRARKSATISMRGTKGDGGIAQMLATRFCARVTDPEFREIGVHQHGDQTWIVLALPFAAPSTEDAPAVARRVLQLINEVRAEGRRCGRENFSKTKPLQLAAALNRAALAHAHDMSAHSYLDHKARDGSMPGNRATRSGYASKVVAENIAAGQPTAELVVQTWIESPGHCANLMDPRYTDTGIAYAVDTASENGIYWVQLYAVPK